MRYLPLLLLSGCSFATITPPHGDAGATPGGDAPVDADMNSDTPGSPDAPEPVLDAPAPDSGTVDAGAVDAGVDAGWPDAGTDAGPDAGVRARAAPVYVTDDRCAIDALGGFWCWDGTGGLARIAAGIVQAAGRCGRTATHEVWCWDGTRVVEIGVVPGDIVRGSHEVGCSVSVGPLQCWDPTQRCEHDAGWEDAYVHDSARCNSDNTITGISGSLPVRYVEGTVVPVGTIVGMSYIYLSPTGLGVCTSYAQAMGVTTTCIGHGQPVRLLVGVPIWDMRGWRVARGTACAVYAGRAWCTNVSQGVGLEFLLDRGAVSIGISPRGPTGLLYTENAEVCVAHATGVNCYFLTNGVFEPAPDYSVSW